MANKDERWEDNTDGAWYVDNSCILCSLCVQLAPNNFKESEAGDHDIVFNQPGNDDELKACEDAKSQCPVEAIGNDGE
ncbi:MAG: ferredoxin [Candidatus Hydrogenedentes bacterium CG07_land_8_20_14_0_80_42_17]|nr:MAG: ferredoxin [Candidatus Hydrogenedentes bacterium CG1_02_42_14]PIU47469.1 MAG: ferredoxin [Candidatus Hydrogenedentes bacterium CG07_land_8_20_14_0_80_42_17]